jgi:hypothetical protein
MVPGLKRSIMKKILTLHIGTGVYPIILFLIVCGHTRSYSQYYTLFTDGAEILNFNEGIPNPISPYTWSYFHHNVDPLQPPAGAWPGYAIDDDVVIINNTISDQSITVGGGNALEIFDYDPNGGLDPVSLTINGNLILNGAGKDTASVVVHPGATLIVNGILEARGNATLTLLEDAYLEISADLVQGDTTSESKGTFTFNIGEGAVADIDGSVDMVGTVDYNVDGTVNVEGLLDFSGNVEIHVDENTGTWNQYGPVDNCSFIWDLQDSLQWDEDRIVVWVYTDPFDCECWDGPDGAITAPACGGPLPVELMSYNGRSNGLEVELTWQTAWEEVNDYFTIERSPDGINYSQVGRVNGQGTTSDEHEYTFTDHTPLLGVSYYKLSQTDFDGTTEVLGVLPVNHSGLANAFRVYPNPVQDEMLSVQLTGLKKQKPAHLRILDLGGREILSKVMPIANGFIDQTISLEGLNRGVYVLTVAQGTKLYRERIVKQ